MKPQLAPSTHNPLGGPKTPEGKAVSSLNRLEHGLAGGQFRVLPSESQEDFDAAVDALMREHQPDDVTEADILRRMAEHAWLARRAHILCDAALIDDDMKKFALMLRYKTANDRAFSNCLNDLIRLRREKRKSLEFESKSNKATASKSRRQSESGENFALEGSSGIPEFAHVGSKTAFGPNRTLNLPL